MSLNDPIIFSIEREWIEAGDISTVLQALESMEEESGLLTIGRNSLSLVTHGYEDDPRELYDIPEVRLWFQTLFHAHPGLFYWLDMNGNMFFLLGLLLFHPRRADGKVGLTTKDLQQFMTEGFLGLE